MGSSPRKLRVLIVDDERYILRALRRGLGDMAEVVGCASTKEALAILAEDAAFDVVLSDWGLDGASGLDLFHDVQTHHPHLRGRCVLMTGQNVEGEELGCEVLSKPFDLTAAREVIQRVSASASPSDETR